MAIAMKTTIAMMMAIAMRLLQCKNVDQEEDDASMMR